MSPKLRIFAALGVFAALIGACKKTVSFADAAKIIPINLDSAGGDTSLDLVIKELSGTLHPVADAVSLVIAVTPPADAAFYHFWVCDLAGTDCSPTQAKPGIFVPTVYPYPNPPKATSLILNVQACKDPVTCGPVKSVPVDNNKLSLAGAGAGESKVQTLLIKDDQCSAKLMQDCIALNAAYSAYLEAHPDTSTEAQKAFAESVRNLSSAPYQTCQIYVGGWHETYVNNVLVNNPDPERDNTLAYLLIGVGGAAFVAGLSALVYGIYAANKANIKVPTVYETTYFKVDGPPIKALAAAAATPAALAGAPLSAIPLTPRNVAAPPVTEVEFERRVRTNAATFSDALKKLEAAAAADPNSAEKVLLDLINERGRSLHGDADERAMRKKIADVSWESAVITLDDEGKKFKYTPKAETANPRTGAKPKSAVPVTDVSLDGLFKQVSGETETLKRCYQFGISSSAIAKAYQSNGGEIPEVNSRIEGRTPWTRIITPVPLTPRPKGRPDAAPASTPDAGRPTLPDSAEFRPSVVEAGGGVTYSNTRPVAQPIAKTCPACIISGVALMAAGGIFVGVGTAALQQLADGTSGLTTADLLAKEKALDKDRLACESDRGKLEAMIATFETRNGTGTETGTGH